MLRIREAVLRATESFSRFAEALITPPVEVQVTQDHIDHGQRWSCKLCPVSLALQETYPGYEIVVSPIAITIGSNVHRVNEALGLWICDFDAGGKTEPIKIKYYRNVWSIA